MAEGSPQAHISVKKSDGTVVRMTLAEFKEYKKQLSSQEQTPVSVPAPVSTPSPVVEEARPEEPPALEPTQEIVPVQHQELATTTPVTDLFVNEAKAKMWNTDDHKSLLDEELADSDVKASDTAMPAIPSRDSALLTIVMTSLPFPIPEEVRGRLQSLIESRVKDVRSDDDVLVYGTRPAADGGLGLSPEQAATLLDTILETLNLPPTSSDTDASLSSELVSDDAERVDAASSDSPDVASSEPAPKEKKTSAFSYDRSRDEIPWQPRFTPESTRSATTAIPTAADGRPLIHDVQAPVQASSRTMGPVDELRSFTLTDLHRLGNTKEKISSTMIDKFTVLRDDSFILYLDAIDAFRQSPLYRHYQEHLLTAINENISLQTALDYDEEGMTLDDVECIVGIMKSVGY